MDDETLKQIVSVAQNSNLQQVKGKQIIELRRKKCVIDI